MAMPELPEVEVVRRGLQHWTSDRVIRDVQVLHPRAVRRHGAGGPDFENQLRGQALTRVLRRGKFLWWPLADDVALIGHLGMSGQFRVDADPGEHTRVILDLDRTRLLFDDQRTFGGLWLDEIVGGLPLSLGHIAADPLSEQYDRAATVRTIRSRRAPIKSLLLDQAVVSGIGNIYADEALWQARVCWRTPGCDLSARKVGQLLDAAVSVMTRAIAAGGTSFDALYVNVNGSSGYFQRDLAAYGQEGLPCLRCGTAILREPFANRSSYRCPRCQRCRRVP
ncbi:MAG: bifunctional DNA-formamidopyrimidine glycosylase/DNA-(apurinic or apyrimidinic site) lyase [Candidatus Nanopelagicales bacterium]|nr:bifunctional DNA-formamidopyrimidine glycosylase/DNA-(apurinic or apyrimidinic site) lyase [Candidatus Nanopelagicales bacterium]